MHRSFRIYRYLPLHLLHSTFTQVTIRMQLFGAVSLSTIANIKLAQESPHTKHVDVKVAVYVI